MRNFRSIAVACALCVSAVFGFAQQIQVNKDNRTIAITTNDTAKANADTAMVHIGFTDYATDAQGAYAAGSRTSAAIVRALTDGGVAKESIQSEAQSVGEVEPFQTQNLTPEQREKRRYRVTQSWTVRTPAADAARVLNLAVNAGANNSGQIEWNVADENALQAQAAGQALQQARQIAEQMAKGLGAQLGTLIYASNEAPASDGGPHPLRMMKSESAPTAASTAPLSISPQQVTRSATVYAVFALQ